MRKILKFVFYILSSLFLLWQLIPVKGNFDKFYIQIVYVLFLVTYIIYESIQLTNDDKIKETPFFINRIKLAIIFSVLLLLFVILIHKNLN